MDIQEKIICRLCLKVCDSFKTFEGELNGVWQMVLKEIDLTIFPQPIMCTYCTAMLTKCSQFKTKCLGVRDCILPFINKDNDLKLNLKEVYLGTSENVIDLSETHDICGFCMSPVKSCSAMPFDVEGGDDTLQRMIKQCLPELDFSVIKKPVFCAPCRNTLESCFCFVTNCSVVEGKIKEYRETQDVNGQVGLSGLLEFMTRDMTINVKKEDTDNEEIDSLGDTFKVEPMHLDLNEGVKEELDLKNENRAEMDDHFAPKNMLAHEGDIKMEKTLSGEGQLKEENVDVLHQLEEEIDIKTEESDFNRYKNDVLPHPEVATRIQKQKCLMADHEKDLSKSCSKQKTNKNISITAYKCGSCSFRTKNRGSLYTHSLMHKDPSKVTMYKCDTCLYQTKHKYRLEMHFLTHKDASEVTMYKCDLCSFQTKLNKSLKRHNMLKHKDASEVTMYICNLCSFQTKLKKSLKQHILKHKDPSEVTMYECRLCSFQTKFVSSIKRHMLKHNDRPEVTKYKCDLCLFETKHKHYLKKHSLKHKDPSEVTVYKCSNCLYQTIRKSNLKIHLLKHKER